MAHVPLDDDTLSVAVFSLSLMGASFTDYLREAHRTLKLDGQPHVFETTARFSDREGFERWLAKLGFAIVSVQHKSKFTHIRAIKTENRSGDNIVIRF
jgi:Hypothetical methyltransferase